MEKYCHVVWGPLCPRLKQWFSLIVKLSEGTVVNCVSRIDTPLRPIHKGTNRQKLSIKS